MTTAQSAHAIARPSWQAIRARATSLVRTAEGDQSYTDVNYIILTFIPTRLPIGLIGLLIVGISWPRRTRLLGAELNSLSTATVMDFYKRGLDPKTDAHYLTVSKIATGLWGLFACAIAVWAAEPAR